MKTISITLDLNEIIYDIQNKTYLTGRSRHGGTNHEQVANMQANGDEESANQILAQRLDSIQHPEDKTGRIYRQQRALRQQ